MTGEQAVAAACRALGGSPETATVLRLADAVTVQLDADRVARVIPLDAAESRDFVRVTDAIPRLRDHVLEPQGPPILTDDAVVIAYPYVPAGLGNRSELAMGGACLSAFHRVGRAALAADDIDLPDFDPDAVARRWLDRARTVLTETERSKLLEAIATHWPQVVGPRAVLHADAHPANWWVAAPDWWVLIDPEFLSIGPAVYDLAPLEVVERRLSLAPSRFASFRSGYESMDGPVDDHALAAAIRVRELLSVAWLAARAKDDSAIALAVRRRMGDALAGREGSWAF